MCKIVVYDLHDYNLMHLHDLKIFFPPSFLSYKMLLFDVK